MENAILIIGEAGSGKSTSLRNLDPASTFIINVESKPLPFRGWKNKFIPVTEGGAKGNYFATDNPKHIIYTINYVNQHRPDIKTLIVDDFGFVYMNGFMRKALLKGYDKYSELGKEGFDILDACKGNREDLFTIFIMHTEIDKHGKYKPKTIGNMTDQYVTIEGKFNYVFHALTNEGNYKFLTQNDGQHMARSTMGVFEDLYVDNDIVPLINAINDFNNYREDGDGN